MSQNGGDVMRRTTGKLLSTLLSRCGYSVVHTKKLASEQAELDNLRRLNDTSISDQSVTLLDLLDQPVPSPQSPKEGLYTPIFSYDGLINDPKVIHNHDFMQDPRYVRAFEAAEKALGYDHKMFWRLHVALWCASQAQKLPGDFVECGVWRGFLATAIMNYIPWPNTNKHFYLFDTWEGLDERYLTDGERRNQAKLNHFKPYYANQYEYVKEHFSNYPNVHLVKGSVPETLDSVEIGAVSYLSLDMNCAPPELAAAEHFWDRLVPGGMILLDDYGFVSYEDQKHGFNQFAARHGIEVLALPTGQGLMVKPPSSSGVMMATTHSNSTTIGKRSREDETFLLMSNARAGSTFLQSSLSALGATSDFEFALRPYGTPISNQKFLSLGVADIAAEIQSLLGGKHSICGSKLVLPLYDYLSTDEIGHLLSACRHISRPIHLVRHYWDLLKSNLSRGVAHDFCSTGRGFGNTSSMHEELSKLKDTDLGRDKPSVFVGLTEAEFKTYLLNLVRNDFAFASAREAKKGITVTYESLAKPETFGRILNFLILDYSTLELEDVLANPSLRKLPAIPDSNIPHEAMLREVTESCYQYYRDGDSERLGASQVFASQLREIERAFS